MLKNETNYIRVREDGWTGLVHADFQHVPIARLAEIDDSTPQRSGFEKVQSSGAAEVYRFGVEAEGRRQLLYLKKHLRRSVLDAVKHLFRASRAKRAFQAALMLEKYQLDTPAIAAFLQKKRGLFACEDILITRGIINPSSLSAVLSTNTLGGSIVGLGARRQMLGEVGRIIGRMHAAGICHGDLRAGNILVRAEERGFKFTFIDNERI